MSTSPTSERTVLLWGHCWWLPGQAEPLGFDAPSDAAHLLAMNLGDQAPAVRLRLIYQPESLVSVEVACPRGNRATLQKALAFEHPELAREDHAWGHEPIFSDADGFGTYLHYEQEPHLFSLVADLASHGIHVTSAWPLASFLHALPEEWSASGAVLVVAAGEQAAMAYHHPAGGKRTLQRWQGADAAGEARAWLQGLMAEEADAPALVLATVPDEAPIDGVRYLALGDALAARVTLPQAHPAQLLPTPPLLTPNRAAIAASILLLLAGGWSGATYAKEYLARIDSQRVASSVKAGLRAEIEHYRVNSREIVALRTKIAGVGASLPIAELLETVCARLPAQLALDRVRVDQGRFTLTGHIAPDASAAWEQWRGQLGSERWTLEPISAPRASGAFTINGAFTP